MSNPTDLFVFWKILLLMPCNSTRLHNKGSLVWVEWQFDSPQGLVVLFTHAILNSVGTLGFYIGVETHLHLLTSLTLRQGFLFCRTQIDSKICHTYGRCFDPFRIWQTLGVKSILEEILHSCKYRHIWEVTIFEVYTDAYSTIKVYFIRAM